MSLHRKTAATSLGHNRNVLDFQLVLPVAYLLLMAAGLVYAIFAAYLYFRSERGADDKRVLIAIAALTLHYAFVFGFSLVRGFVLVPTLLLFLMALTPVLAIWFGSQAGTKAGSRITLAGAFALAAFILKTGYEIHRWS